MQKPYTHAAARAIHVAVYATHPQREMLITFLLMAMVMKITMAKKATDVDARATAMNLQWL
jgi:hypothetical protein